jgi:predicted deacylase
MAAEVVTIGNVSCAPGCSARGSVDVATGPDGHPMGFPVMIVNGALPGKRLCLVAAIHGDEYEGMEAVRRTMAGVDPKTLRGALIGLPCVNIPAFEVAARCSGIDHLNLNRIFPGDKDSTLSMKWAAKFVSDVIPNIDALIDLHSGGGFGEIVPLVIIQAGFEELATGIGLAAGNDVVWKGGKWGGTGRIATLQAGKPAITVEIGGGGGCQESTVALHVKVIRNVMRHLNLVDGTPETPREYRVVKGTFSYSSMGGFFRKIASPGQVVRRGEVLGAVINHYGDVLEEYTANQDGMVLWIRTRCTIFPGEETVIFGEIAERLTP